MRNTERSNLCYTTIFTITGETMTKLSQLLLSTLTLALIVSVGYTKSSASWTGTSEASPASAPGGVSGTQVKMVARAVATGDAAHGKTLFGANCASCHGATGTEGGVGPSLKGEKSKKNQAAAVAWIKNPKPPMPKLYPSPLSEKDVSDVAAYVETL
jgi:mono/diheme cytochrome c family protein